MASINWHRNILILGLATAAVAGCSSLPNAAATMQSNDVEFFVEDEAVRGFARIADDGYLEIIQNRAFGPSGGIDRHAPGSKGFLLFTSALGGVGPGEVKRVPKYSGLAFMESDGTIHVNYLPRPGSDPVTSPPLRFTSTPSDPAYSLYMEIYHLRDPGDGYLIP